MVWVCLKALCLVMALSKKRFISCLNQLGKDSEANPLDSVKQLSVLLPFLVPRSNRRLQVWMEIRLLCIFFKKCYGSSHFTWDRNILNQSSNHADKSGLIAWTSLYFLIKRGIHVLDRLSEGMIARFLVGEIRKAAFGHTLSLSSEFHFQTDMEEIKAIIKKANSLNGLLNLLLFEFLRTMISLIISCFTLYAKFGPFICFLAVFGSSLCMSGDVYLFSGNVNESETERHLAHTVLMRAMNQALENHVTVELYNRRRYHNDVYGDVSDSELESERR